MVKLTGFFAACLLSYAVLMVPAHARTFDSAVDQCALVAAEEQSGDQQDDSRLRGLCIRSTAEFLATLKVSGLGADKVGAELASYVVALAQLLNERSCRPDSEIPRAISMVGEESSDPEQALQIRQISLTVINCSFGTTAALPAGSTPASLAETSGGRSAALRVPLTIFPDSAAGTPASAN